MGNGPMRACQAFDLIAQLAIKLGAAPMSKHSGCWRHAVDEHWTIVLNGHEHDQKHEGVTVPPFHCYVEFNGFPAGLFHPVAGGLIAAGSAVNETTFLAALRAALERAA
jgi:hypothetical protein